MKFDTERRGKRIVSVKSPIARVQGADEANASIVISPQQLFEKFVLPVHRQQ